MLDMDWRWDCRCDEREVFLSVCGAKERDYYDPTHETPCTGTRPFYPGYGVLEAYADVLVDVIALVAGEPSPPRGNKLCIASTWARLWDACIVDQSTYQRLFPCGYVGDTGGRVHPSQTSSCQLATSVSSGDSGRN